MLTLSKFKPTGTITIPSSKSHTIRALLIAAFAKGISYIKNPLQSEDTKSAIKILTSCGVLFTYNPSANVLTVDSTNLNLENNPILDCGNSGTTLYLCLGLLASLNLPFTLTGDKQLCLRPITPLVDAYKALGVKVEEKKDHLPLTFTGKLKGGACSIVCKTSQYLSSLLLSLPLAEKESIIDCPLLYEKPYVGMTLSWLDKQNIKYEKSDDLAHYKIYPNQNYKPFNDFIPGDYSSATFFFCLAALTGSTITVEGLVKEDSQGDKEVLTILEKMGCLVIWEGTSVSVKGPKNLKGGHFDLNAIPDSIAALAVTAAYATEPVYLENVANARIKETDRIAVMKENLTSLQVKCEDTPDSLIIYPTGVVHGGFVKGYEDHRIIMAMAICSANSIEPITIDEEKAVDVTFPTFFSLLNLLKEAE